MVEAQLRCPAGWRIIKQRPCHAHPGEYIVLCEKVGRRLEDTRYVSWRTAPGHGCMHGRYSETESGTEYGTR